MLSENDGQKLLEEIKNLNDLEEEKIYTGVQTNKVPPNIRKTVKRSISESQDKNIWNLDNKMAAHGGALEKLNNEERLNFLSEANISKIDGMNSLNRRAEKSVELSFRTGNFLDRNSTDFITNKVISSNLLSKYLSKFIESKDYKSTEEREYEKCTFKPNFVNKKKFKNVNSKLAGYIKENDAEDKNRNVALFSASENIKGLVQSRQSIGRGMSLDSRLNSSIWMSDGGFLFKTKANETTTVSVLNEMRSIPTIYSNKNASGLGGILQFGYSHKYHEKKHYTDIIKPMVKNIRESNTSYKGSVKALSLSNQDLEGSSYFQSKFITPLKSNQGIKTHRQNNKNIEGLNEAKDQQPKEQEDQNNRITTDKLEEIRKIHEIHFKLKRS